jgi:hypothetical protein
MRERLDVDGEVEATVVDEAEAGDKAGGAVEEVELEVQGFLSEDRFGGGGTGGEVTRRS